MKHKGENGSNADIFDGLHVLYLCTTEAMHRCAGEVMGGIASLATGQI